MSPSLSSFVGYGVLLEKGVTAHLHEVEDELRGPECYNYAHYHPDYSHDWEDEKKEQFRKEHADEIEEAKERFKKLEEKYLVDIEPTKVGVMDFTQSVLIYSPTYQRFGREVNPIEMERLSLEPEEKQTAKQKIHMYLGILGLGDEDIETGPDWIGGASYW